MEFVKHKNIWNWGDSIIIITSDAYGIVTVSFETRDLDVAYISGLSVVNDKRNQGYGSILLEEAEKEIKNRNCKVIYIGCDPNLWVYSWYKRKGYIYDGEEESDKNLVRLKKEL